ncbi:MAG: hypothetical protein IKB98_01730 [Clostridia bacterium]|nr:hypothetical protein [Clostridia bacterium]
MTYREQLNKVNELGINICDLTIANELNCVLDAEAYTAKKFERLCEYARYIYLKADSITAEAIARAIEDLLSQGKTVGKIVAMNKYSFIDKAVCYM